MTGGFTVNSKGGQKRDFRLRGGPGIYTGIIFLGVREGGGRGGGTDV